MSGQSRSLLLIVAAAVLLTSAPLDEAVFAQNPYPTQWVGIVATSVNADGNVAVVTIDREGGSFDETPGSKPDGVVDWVFVLTYTASRPPNLNGPATLRMTEGRVTYLDFLEISTAKGRPVMFRAELPEVPRDRASTEFLPVCKIIRVHPAPSVKMTHEATAKIILTGKWSPCL